MELRTPSPATSSPPEARDRPRNQAAAGRRPGGLAAASGTPSQGAVRPGYQPMVLVLAAVAGGILVDRCWSWPLSVTAIAAITAGGLWLIAGRLKGRAVKARSLLVLAVAMCLGSAWHHVYWHWYPPETIGRYAAPESRVAALRMTILSEPRRAAVEAPDFVAANGLEQHTRMLVELVSIRNRDQWEPACGRADLVIHAAIDSIRPGDQVEVYGRLVGNSPPTNPGQFDFGWHARRQRKLASVHVYEPRSVVVVQPATWRTTRWISDLRRRLNGLIESYVAAPQAAFASAILLGNREQLAPRRRERFVETGTVHLLAISGLHVGILAGAMLLLLHLPWGNREIWLWLTILFVVGYAWLVEFRSPATRASILIVLLCLGRILGERAFSLNLLGLAALIVLMLNPTDLFGVGPQLSFLAVATITLARDLIFWPPTKDPLRRLIAATRPRPMRWLASLGRGLRAAFLVSAVIWLAALPLVAHHFHLVTPAGLLVNPLLLMPIAISLVSGLGILLTGFWLGPLARGLGWLCYSSLAAVDLVVIGIHQWPGGHRWTAGPPEVAVGLFYVMALFWAACPRWRPGFRTLAGMYLAWVVLAWWLPMRWQQRPRADAPLVSTIVDVGHGSAVLLELPNGENWLYDAGSFGASRFAARNVSGALWEAGIDSLDGLIVSHADVDHFNAVPELMRRFRVRGVYVTGPMLRSDSPSVAELFDAISQSRTPLFQLEAGDRYQAGPITSLRVLGPGNGGERENDNADSLILLVEHAGQRLLLPGDLEGGGLERLLSHPPLDIDVLMAPHHGSPHSRPEDVAEWCTPELVVVSGGANRVQDRSVARFAGQPPGATNSLKIARTDRDGAIRVRLGDDRIRYQTWNSHHWSDSQEVAAQPVQD